MYAYDLLVSIMLHKQGGKFLANTHYAIFRNMADLGLRFAVGHCQHEAGICERAVVENNIRWHMV